MSDETDENHIHEMSKALIESVENISPLFDAGGGMRADLERRGWSAESAEEIARIWIVNVMNRVFFP